MGLSFQVLKPKTLYVANSTPHHNIHLCFSPKRHVCSRLSSNQLLACVHRVTCMLRRHIRQLQAIRAVAERKEATLFFCKISPVSNHPAVKCTSSGRRRSTARRHCSSASLTNPQYHAPDNCRSSGRQRSVARRHCSSARSGRTAPASWRRWCWRRAAPPKTRSSPTTPGAAPADRNQKYLTFGCCWCCSCNNDAACSWTATGHVCYLWPRRDA